VLYARAEGLLAEFSARTGVPVAETQAGKGALVWNHPAALGAVGVTGTGAANSAAAAADLVIGMGARLQDFTTGSRALFANAQHAMVQVNVAAFDAYKHGAYAVVGDAGAVLEALSQTLRDWRAPQAWSARALDSVASWTLEADAVLAASDAQRPSDAQVIGAVWRGMDQDAIVVCAAGGLPGELHKLWRVRRTGGYHVEYGYSCMGYEIAGGLGVKLAEPDREVVVMVGDGSYLMMNSEIATSVAMGQKLIITVLDNRGFGCISRLQQSMGGAAFNNLLDEEVPGIDFASHAASLGARSEKVGSIAGLESALQRAKSSDRTFVIVIDTDPAVSTEVGGAWWDVAVAEVSARPDVLAAREAYELATKNQHRGD
jgi:3D-(3,5/4)-trihydroxycyclohexane-1,2-dione acylhydrolase (decyclizing)